MFPSCKKQYISSTINEVSAVNQVEFNKPSWLWLASLILGIVIFNSLLYFYMYKHNI